MKCPGCGEEQGDFAVCDNDCGTFICLDCNCAFYYSEDKYGKEIIICEHCKYCGCDYDLIND